MDHRAENRQTTEPEHIKFQLCHINFKLVIRSTNINIYRETILLRKNIFSRNFRGVYQNVAELRGMSECSRNRRIYQNVAEVRSISECCRNRGIYLKLT